MLFGKTNWLYINSFSRRESWLVRHVTEAEITKTEFTEICLTIKSHWVKHPLVSTQSSSFHFPPCHFPLPPPPSSMTGCLLGLTYESSLTLGYSKCPADSFAVISQSVLPVTMGTFGRQVTFGRQCEEGPEEHGCQAGER